MPEVTEILIPTNAEMGVAVEGSTSAWPNATNETAQPVLPEFDVFNQSRHYIDVFNKGQTPFEFSALSSSPWIMLSATNGTIEKEQRLWVSVDWNKTPKGPSDGFVRIEPVIVKACLSPRASSDSLLKNIFTRTRAKPVTVKVNAFNPPEPTRDSLKGFVEADGCVSIEAAHHTEKTDAGLVRWEEIPDYGRTLSAMTIFPVTAQSVTPPENSPCLEYKMYLFHSGKVAVTTIIAPTLNFVPGRGLRFALSFDDQPPQIVTAVPEDFNAGDGNQDWEKTVEDSVRKVESTFTLTNSGYHTLKFWMVDPGVVLEKLVVNLGGVKPSYFGPPESHHGSESAPFPH